MPAKCPESFDKIPNSHRLLHQLDEAVQKATQDSADRQPGSRTAKRRGRAGQSALKHKEHCVRSMEQSRWGLGPFMWAVHVRTSTNQGWQCLRIRAQCVLYEYRCQPLPGGALVNLTTVGAHALAPYKFQLAECWGALRDSTAWQQPTHLAP
jgi:hypothetical protein